MFSHHCERGLHVTHSQQLASILSTPLEYQFRMWSPWHRNWIFLESMSRGADQPSRFPPLPCRFSNMQHVADTHHRLMIGFDMFNKLQFNLTENQKTLAGSRWFKACRMSFLFQSRIWPRYRKKSTGDQKKGRQKIRDAEVGLAMGLETEGPLKNHWNATGSERFQRHLGWIES